MSTSGNYYQSTAGQASDLPVPPDVVPEKTLSAAEWGMASFLLSEAAFFSTLIVAYVTFRGRDLVGPTPSDTLTLPLVLASSSLLLASSATIHLATGALERGKPTLFKVWWFVTILLGIGFLVGTAVEWHELIYEHHLTISRNLFGTTYYTLVGFHALHVTLGVVAMLIVVGLALRGQVNHEHGTSAHLVSWYWHFVDAVWIVVFIVVYL